MNIRADTLEIANSLERAGIARPHAEAIAKVQASTVKDLLEQELVTKDYLKAELAQMKAELRTEFKTEISGLRTEIAEVELRLRDEIRAVLVQIRALQFDGAIAAFSVGAIVLMAPLIR